jgi:hypothetical protein
MSTWKEYRRRERLVWAISILGIPGAGLLALPLSMLLHSTVPFEATYCLFALAWLFGMLRVQFFRCPRCNNHFFFKWYFSNIFAKRCVHCGLPRLQETSLDEH